MSSLRVRLDVVVEMKERRAQKALAALASAQKNADTARTEVELAQQRLMFDDRGSGAAGLWAVADAASGRVRQEVQAARRKAEDAAGVAKEALGVATRAKREQQVMDRAAETKRQELREEDRRKERRSSDELATALFNRE